MKTKSPVPERSLPNPGESSQTMMEDRWFDRMVMPVVVSSILGFHAVMEWEHLVWKTSPWFWTFLFVLSVIFCVYRYRTMYPELRQRSQGIRGERIVGQMLEDLRAVGCKVYHDIVEDGYNIDHVIIGPHGVFTIETKTLSKPAQGQSAVAFDGETVQVGNSQADPAPVIQAKAEARRVREILRKMTGQEPDVTPVLLYINWYVEQYTRDASVIVMNEKYFFKSFDRLRNRNALPMDQVNFLAAGLERYLREKANQ